MQVENNKKLSGEDVFELIITKDSFQLCPSQERLRDRSNTLIHLQGQVHTDPDVWCLSLGCHQYLIPGLREDQTYNRARSPLFPKKQGLSPRIPEDKGVYLEASHRPSVYLSK